ncbi:MAG: Rpn family recombination-promoting nuclease/putative transposase [Lachnospiraceae bacterium]
MSQTLQDLTLKDNFLFGAVMADEKNCKPLLEMILGFPIDRVEVSKEYSMIYHPEYRSIRMDVYAKDGKNTRYNVEMQTSKKSTLAKRSRYYHSQMDMDLLVSGADYDKLPNVYLIFICDFDPFGEKKFCYRFENQCVENGVLSLKDGNYTIFLSTKGLDSSEISPELYRFLKFLSMDLKASEHPSGDPFITQLQDAIQKVKKSRDMEGRYMLFELLLKDEHDAGLQEGMQQALYNQILDFLNDLDPVPQELSDKIIEEKNLDILKRWVKLSARVSNVQEFEDKMDIVVSDLTKAV